MTPTEDLETELAAGPLACNCNGTDDGAHADECCTELVEALTAWVVKRESGFRETLDRVWAANAEALEVILYALDAPYNGEPLSGWARALVRERDALREQLATAKADGANEERSLHWIKESREIATLRADLNAAMADYTETRVQLAARDREIELLREVEKAAADLLPLCCDQQGLPDVDEAQVLLAALDAYRASQADKGGEGEP